MGYNDFRGGGSSRSQFEDKSEVKQAIEIKSFYKTGTETPMEDLFDAQAQKIADTFVGKNKKGEACGISPTQLRRIFDEVKRFERVLTLANSKWEEQLPYIKMIKSKVAYAVARKSKGNGGKPTPEAPFYKNLETFLSSGINQIKTEKDYQVFVALFEAVYGFYYELAPKKD